MCMEIMVNEIGQVVENQPCKRHGGSMISCVYKGRSQDLFPSKNYKLNFKFNIPLHK